MTLDERAARLARARPGDGLLRSLGQAIALSVIGLVFAIRQDLWPIAVAAGVVFGWTSSRDPERYYLEGFSDGLAALPASGPARHRARPEPDLGELPQGAGVDGGGPRRTRSVVRPSDRGFGPPGGRDAVGDLADALGVHDVPGPARPALDADARPLPTVRPIRPAAIVPEAERAGSVGRPPALGSQAGPQAGAGRSEEDTG